MRWRSGMASGDERYCPDPSLSDEVLRVADFQT